MDISGEFVELTGDFLQSLALLLVAIGLTGFLIPLVLRRVDERTAVQRQLAQARLARQDAVIAAQAAVLDALAELLWDYQRLAAEQLYAGAQATSDAARFGAAAAYDAGAGPLLGRARAEVSKLRLAPRPLYEAFLALYHDELLPFDRCLT